MTYWHGLLILLVSAWAVPWAEAAEEPQRIERTQPHMGTEFKIVVYAVPSEAAEAAVAAAFERIGELDAMLSDYRSDSELMLLCGAAPQAEPVTVSRDLWAVLRQAEVVSRASDGAFDVTVGHLTKLWRRARRQKALPPAELLRAGLARVGFDQIELAPDAPRVRLTQADVRIDLGAIAKGYAAQMALNELQSRGFGAALVDAGGNLVVGAPPPGTPGWRVGVAALQRDEPPSRILQVTQQSIATSGDLSQFVEIDGRRYSHILDPRTGLGLPERSSVTVIARDGALGDALATAINVLGPERGLELAARFEAEVLYTWLAERGVRQSRETPGFAKFNAPAP